MQETKFDAGFGRPTINICLFTNLTNLYKVFFFYFNNTFAVVYLP